MTNPITLDLNQRVALVTGGSNGIGKGCALSLARCGANIVIIDIDETNGLATVAEIEALGSKALFIQANMMDETQFDSIIDKIKAHFGRLDILINNVGGGRPTPLLEQSKNSVHRHVSLNLLSTVFLTQAALPLIISGKRGGVIVNVASTEALRAAPGFAVYAACKAGVVSFTKTMALELAEHNIRSYAMAPDMIATPGLAPLMKAATPSQQAARDRYIPNGRMGTLDEFGNTVAFLASDNAAYLNGITIPVDAGATAAAGWYRDPNNNWCLFHGD